MTEAVTVVSSTTYYFTNTSSASSTASSVSDNSTPTKIDPPTVSFFPPMTFSSTQNLATSASSAGTSMSDSSSPHVKLVEILVPIILFLFCPLLFIYLHVKCRRRIQAATHSSLLVLPRGNRRSTPTSYTSSTASIVAAGDTTQGDWRPEMSFAPSSPIPPARPSVRSPLRSYTLTSPSPYPSLFLEESDLQHLVADSHSTTYKREGRSRVSYTDTGHHQIVGELDNGERPRASVNIDLSSDAPALIPSRKKEDRLSRISVDISFHSEQESAVSRFRGFFRFVALDRFPDLDSGPQVGVAN